jgi:hypothetical protein
MCSISLGIDISLNRSVVFATDLSEEEAEDNDEEADEDELLDARTGFLDKDAGLSFSKGLLECRTNMDTARFQKLDVG